jgi:p-hydroxybenzoate 3-monooxygenase
MRTQVAIVGAGPAGLLLSQLLSLDGIDSVIVENRTRGYVEARIRAGLLEHGTIELLKSAGVGDRLVREGMFHDGIELRFGGRSHRIDMRGLTGRGVAIYGQHEVVKDLIAARLAGGTPILFAAEDVAVADIASKRPRVTFKHEGRSTTLEADFIAGCDGYHGICRPAIPAGVLKTYERDYPFGWLGVLAEVPPVAPELIYTAHPRGFALFTMRSPQLSRLYLQCPPDDDEANWSDERFWEELSLRFAGEDGARPNVGRIVAKGVTPMRSFMVEPMQHGNLFLAGDAAHIVPPTGAKGMNLAVADVRVLAIALADFYNRGSRERLDAFSATCLKRVWRAEHFSWWMTQLMHTFSGDDPFQERMQDAERAYVVSSKVAATALAENYAGLEWGALL